MTIDAVDAYVGNAIRRRRLLTGMSQMDLAARIGVKFQQVQKYETGANRVSASRLAKIATAFGCHAGDFFPPQGDSADTPHPLDGEILTLCGKIAHMPDAQRHTVKNMLRAAINTQIEGAA